MKEISVLASDKKGFEVVYCFENWQIGIINYTEALKEVSLSRLEKHEKTDEVFILLAGSASLFIGKELKETKLETGNLYNIPRNTWHTITLSEDASVAVVENSGTEKRDKIKFNGEVIFNENK